SQDGKIVDLNPACEQALRLSRAEIVGRPLQEFVAPDSVQAVMAHTQSGEGSAYEIMALRGDKTTFPAEVRGRSILYKGQPARISSMRDLTEQKQGETERDRLLKEAERSAGLLRSVIDSTPDWIVMKAPETFRITLSNKSFASAFGKTPQE